MCSWPGNFCVRERGFELADVGGDDRLQIGVERRGRGALELADFGQHLVRGGDEFVRPDRAQCGERAALVLGIGVGVDEGDGDACAPLSRSCFAAARTSAGSTAVRMLPSASVRSFTSTRMSRSAIGMKSPHRPQVRRRSRRRISSTSRKPRVVMTPIFGPRRSSSVLVPTVVPCTIESIAGGAAERVEAVEEALRLVAAARRHLGGAEAAGRRIEQEQVGEGAADIDADDDAALAHGAGARLRGGGGVERAVVAQHDLVVAARGLARDVAEPHVADDALGLARRRIAEAAAARRLQPHLLAAADLDVGDLRDQRRRLPRPGRSHRRSD